MAPAKALGWICLVPGSSCGHVDIPGPHKEKVVFEAERLGSAMKPHQLTENLNLRLIGQ